MLPDSIYRRFSRQSKLTSYLVCATCTINWSFRRVACAYCGEERPTKLGFFTPLNPTTSESKLVIPASVTFRGVDLTSLEFAIPLVDEVAAAALDVWSHEHGYTKIELNLAGL
jgi:formate dehydrogenase maturation protein FdhE